MEDEQDCPFIGEWSTCVYNSSEDIARDIVGEFFYSGRNKDRDVIRALSELTDEQAVDEMIEGYGLSEKVYGEKVKLEDGAFYWDLNSKRGDSESPWTWMETRGLVREDLIEAVQRLRTDIAAKALAGELDD